MDDAWPGRWPPPPAAPAPSQMETNLRYLFRPLGAQEATADSRAMIEEQVVSSPLNFLSGQSGKVGPSNSFLAQVPGNYYRVINSNKLVDKSNAVNSGGINDPTCASPLSNIMHLSKHQRHGPLAISSEHSSGSDLLTKNVDLQSNFRGGGSTNDDIPQGSAQFQSASAYAVQKLPSKSMSYHHPALLRDHLRVSCLNTGGEFFVGEAGIFGILCFCHGFKMSVAKFCEHSGAPAEKAGEVVRMENGLSIAQWFSYCIGVGTSVADTNWDWPEWACTKNSPDEHMLKKHPTRNNIMEKVELFGRFGTINGPSIYSSDLYIGGGGCTTINKLVNKPDETCHRRSVDVQNSFTKISNLPQITKTMNLALAKNHTVQAMKINPVNRPIGSADLAANKGGNYNGNHLACNNANLLEKHFDASFLNALSSSKEVLSYDNSTSRFNIAQKIFQDSLGNVSNTELKLGQPSYHQPMAGLFPSLQSTVIGIQKPQPHQPSITQSQHIFCHDMNLS